MNTKLNIKRIIAIIISIVLILSSLTTIAFAESVKEPQKGKPTITKNAIESNSLKMVKPNIKDVKGSIIDILKKYAPEKVQELEILKQQQATLLTQIKEAKLAQTKQITDNKITDTVSDARKAKIDELIVKLEQFKNGEIAQEELFKYIDEQKQNLSTMKMLDMNAKKEKIKKIAGMNESNLKDSLSKNMGERKRNLAADFKKSMMSKNPEEIIAILDKMIETKKADITKLQAILDSLKSGNTTVETNVSIQSIDQMLNTTTNTDVLTTDFLLGVQ